MVGRSYPQDEGLDVIRMDGLIRKNAKTGIGEYVEVTKAEWKEAKKVILAPVIQNIHIYAPSESLRAFFNTRTVSKGDIISTTSVRKPKESFGSEVMFEQIFQGMFPSFGLGEIKLQVVSTTPQGIVKITDITELELLPEAVALEQEIPEVMYEDIGGHKPALQELVRPCLQKRWRMKAMHILLLSTGLR